MSEKAKIEREKQVESLRTERQKVLQVRSFLLSEREIVLGLLKKSLAAGDQERLNNLRTRIHEKGCQLQLVEGELRDITFRLREAERRLRDIGTEDGAKK